MAISAIDWCLEGQGMVWIPILQWSGTSWIILMFSNEWSSLCLVTKGWEPCGRGTWGEKLFSLPVWWLDSSVCIRLTCSGAGDPSCALDPWSRGRAREGSSEVHRGTPSRACRAGVATRAAASSKQRGKRGGAQAGPRQCDGGRWRVWEGWGCPCSPGVGWWLHPLSEVIVPLVTNWVGCGEGKNHHKYCCIGQCEQGPDVKVG